MILGLPPGATTVPLVADAGVNAAHPTANYGALSNLYVGNGGSAYLQFDLTTLPAGIRASQIAKATLTVYVNRVTTGGNVTLSPVTSAWTESALTYATQPGLGGSAASFEAAPADQYVTLDVTSLVQGWVTAPATNNGVALTSSSASLLLDSKENGRLPIPPILRSPSRRWVRREPPVQQAQREPRGRKASRAFLV